MSDVIRFPLSLADAVPVYSPWDDTDEPSRLKSAIITLALNRQIDNSTAHKLIRILRLEDA